MSTSKTENLGLHSWAGDDQFSRAEINGNFSAIDRALGMRAVKLADITLTEDKAEVEIDFLNFVNEKKYIKYQLYGPPYAELTVSSFARLLKYDHASSEWTDTKAPISLTYGSFEITDVNLLDPNCTYIDSYFISCEERYCAANGALIKLGINNSTGFKSGARFILYGFEMV